NKELYERYKKSKSNELETEYLNKINDFVKKNNIKYIKKYQDVLNKYDISVTFINSNGDIL
ncbi:MAG: hypothetical protein MJ232_08485, partial [archaeon]|nr:hypothetical protein [archaeon]